MIFRLFLYSFAFFLLTFFVYHLCLLAVYVLPGYDLPTAAEALWTSLRLDLAAGALLLFPIVLLSIPSAFGAPRPLLLKVLRLATASLLTGTLLICVASFVFYRERHKPLEEEFFLYWDTDIIPGIAGAFQAHTLLISISLVVLVVLFIAFSVGLKRLLASPKRLFPSAPLNVIFFVFTLAALFVLARGTGSRPLRSGQILHSKNIIVNHVAINPVYNIFIDGLKSFLDEGSYLFYDEDEAVQTTRRLLSVSADPFTDAEYPLLRTMRSGRNKDLKNVIIVQLEGFSNGFVGYRRGGREVTPFINGLAGRSVYFPFFVQNVRFTHRALFVINSSYLDRATARSILKSPEVRHRYSSLPRILEADGYSLLYLEGGDASYENMRSFLEMQGYSIFDGLVMEESGRYGGVRDRKDAFGYHDEFVFDEAVFRLERARQPFMGYITTHSTHSPWMPPGHFESRFEKPYGVFEYTDWALGRFFRQLEKKGLLENTVVVITADHTSLPVRGLGHFDRMNIPLIIHAGDLEPERIKTIGSQVDILPTLLGLLGLDVPYASMGRNLLGVPENGGFACSVFNGYAFWHEKNVILKDWLGDRQPAQLFERLRPEKEQVDISGRHQPLVEKLQHHLRSYYQTGRSLSLQDRVLPRTGSTDPAPTLP